MKRLDLIGIVPEELWTEVYNIVQKAVTKTISKKKKCKKTKWLSEEALQITEEERREAKGKGERQRYIQKQYGHNRNRRYRQTWQEYINKNYTKKVLMTWITMMV